MSKDNYKQLTNQIDKFSINLHSHQQQLQEILESIQSLVTYLQNEPNNQYKLDEKYIIESIEKLFKKHLNISHNNHQNQSKIDQNHLNLETKLNTLFKEMQSIKQQKSNSNMLSIDIFLDRINEMQQRFESKIQQISDNNTQFQQYVMKQLNDKYSSKPQTSSKNSHHNNPNDLSMWMTIQEIDHNTKDLKKEIQQLKEQQIAQFESITKTIFQGRISNETKSDKESTDSYNYNIRRGSRPSISMDHRISNKNSRILSCDSLSDWSKMTVEEKKSFCSTLMTRLFSKELHQQRVEPRNSFYLVFAKRLIQEWKEQKKWDDENWEMMDNKKQLISKIWAFMLLNWDEILAQTQDFN